MFFINLPLCVIGLVAAYFGLPKSTPGERRQLDIVGMSLLSPGVVFLLYGLSDVSERGFGDLLVLGPVVAGATLVLPFVRHGFRTRLDPVLDPRLFRDRGFALSGVFAVPLRPLALRRHVAAAALLSAGAGEDGVGGRPAARSPGPGQPADTQPAGTMIDQLGARPVVIWGMAAAALGTIAFTQVGSHPSPWLLGVSLVLRGAGLAAAQTAVMAQAYQGLSRDKVPHGSTATRILQQVGGSFGAVVVAVLLQWQLGHHGADQAGVEAAFGSRSGGVWRSRRSPWCPPSSCPGAGWMNRNPSPNRIGWRARNRRRSRPGGRTAHPQRRSVSSLARAPGEPAHPAARGRPPVARVVGQVVSPAGWMLPAAGVAHSWSDIPSGRRSIGAGRWFSRNVVQLISMHRYLVPVSSPMHSASEGQGATSR